MPVFCTDCKHTRKILGYQSNICDAYHAPYDDFINKHKHCDRLNARGECKYYEPTTEENK